MNKNLYLNHSKRLIRNGWTVLPHSHTEIGKNSLVLVGCTKTKTGFYKTYTHHGGKNLFFFLFFLKQGKKINSQKYFNRAYTGEWVNFLQAKNPSSLTWTTVIAAQQASTLTTKIHSPKSLPNISVPCQNFPMTFNSSQSQIQHLYQGPQDPA